MSDPVYSLCFLMDPYETLNLDTETSLLCMDELLARGHRVFWLQQEDLSLEGNVVTGRVSRLRSTAPFMLDAPEKLRLDEFDAVVIRKDPPFDGIYLHLTYLLDFLPATTKVINSPAALRTFNEKLATLNWPEACPETLVAMNVDQLAEFVRTHHKVVLKPLDNCSGREITFVDATIDSLHEDLIRYRNRSGSPQFVLAQKYLPGVARGDKRVYLVDGEPVGWVNRVPAEGSDLANIHQGAICEPTSLTEQEQSLSMDIGAKLKAEGILLAGLDFIDGRLTEINLTSPSAVRQINAVSGEHLEVRIVDAMLSAIEDRASAPCREARASPT